MLGIPDEAILKYKNGDLEDLQGSVILSMRESSYVEEHAVGFVVPSGMTLKTHTAKDKIEGRVTKLMSSNYNKQNNTFLLTFEPR